jgi:hypothetical protein
MSKIFSGSGAVFIFAGLTLFSSCHREFSCADPVANSGDAAIPSFKRVFTVILENTNADDALAQPYLRELTQSGAYATDIHALRRPSQPNYIALTAGATLGVSSNSSELSLAAKHIGNLVEESGKRWKAYAEDYPGNCFLGASSGNYTRKHVPFLSYQNVQQSPERCARVVPATQLALDVAEGTLPDFSLFIPNNFKNGHDTGIAYGDQWLRQTFEPLLGNPAFMDGTLFVVTFDESGPDKSNRIYTSFNGRGVQPGARTNSCYTLYNLLKTFEVVLGLGSLQRADHPAAPVQGIWNALAQEITLK